MDIILTETGIGNNTKTIIENFSQIVFNLESNPKYVQKILSNIIDKQCSIENNKLILNGKHDSTELNFLINTLVFRYKKFKLNYKE